MFSEGDYSIFRRRALIVRLGKIGGLVGLARLVSAGKQQAGCVELGLICAR